MEFLRRVTAAHTRLKETIHGARIPLSPRGRKIMAFVYFLTPVVAGYFIMVCTAKGARFRELARRVRPHLTQFGHRIGPRVGTCPRRCSRSAACRALFRPGASLSRPASAALRPPHPTLLPSNRPTCARQAIEERRRHDASMRGGKNFAASGLDVVEDAHRDSSSRWAERMDGMRRRPSVPTGDDAGEDAGE